jgi:hypothetical protein
MELEVFIREFLYTFVNICVQACTYVLCMYVSIFIHINKRIYMNIHIKDIMLKDRERIQMYIHIQKCVF